MEQEQIKEKQLEPQKTENSSKTLLLLQYINII